MNLFKLLVSRSFYLVVMTTLLLGSCAVPGYLFYNSPKLILEEIDSNEVDKISFFVAFMADNDLGSKSLYVDRPKYIKEQKHSNVQYHIPEKHMSYSFDAGEDAYIDVIEESQDSQIIQVMVHGDTPWSSLSEYRVSDNKVYPLRHSHSMSWILLGMLIGPAIVARISMPIRRRIDRVIGIEERSEVTDTDDLNSQEDLELQEKAKNKVKRTIFWYIKFLIACYLMGAVTALVVIVAGMGAGFINPQSTILLGLLWSPLLYRLKL